MPLEIIRNDITKVHVDAIVNTANPSLLGGRGVDGAIHRAAGPELLAECRALGGCNVGQAKITSGYKLPAKYVIHTVGPIWHGGSNGEEKLLTECYLNSLALATEHHLESIAFPLISSGAYGYPKDKALQVAISVISDFLLKNELTIYLVVFDKTSFAISEKLFSSITQYIDDNYIEEYLPIRFHKVEESRLRQSDFSLQSASLRSESAGPSARHKRSLADLLDQPDETFSQMLLRLITEKGFTEADSYNRANIDRKLFSKIRNDVHYKPGKPTVLSFAIALRLNLDETRDLLLKAGFALSRSSKFDIIIEYFLEKGNYNVFEINAVLFKFDQKLLGV